MGQIQELVQAETDAHRASALANAGMLSKQSVEQSHTGVTTLKVQLEASRKVAEVARAKVTQS